MEEGLHTWYQRYNSANAESWVAETLDWVKVELKSRTGTDPRELFGRQHNNQDGSKGKGKTGKSAMQNHDQNKKTLSSDTRVLLKFRPTELEKHLWHPIITYITKQILTREQGEKAGVQPRGSIERKFCDNLNRHRSQSDHQPASVNNNGKNGKGKEKTKI